MCGKALSSTNSFWVIPREARFINLSRGIARGLLKGGQISICLYIFRRCPHSCLATKPNRDRWQLRTLMFLHFLLASLRTFACWHVYSSSVNKLLDQFLMQMRDQAKTATPDLTSGWKSIQGDLQLKPSVNADLKFSAYNEGETVDDKRVANIVYR